MSFSYIVIHERYFGNETICVFVLIVCLFLDYTLVVNRRVKVLGSLVQNRVTSSGIFVAMNFEHIINRLYIDHDIFECILLFNKWRRKI